MRSSNRMNVSPYKQSISVANLVDVIIFMGVELAVKHLAASNMSLMALSALVRACVGVRNKCGM